MFIIFELQEILRHLEDEGTRALFTDSKSQYHHSIKKASLLNGQFSLRDVSARNHGTCTYSCFHHRLGVCFGKYMYNYHDILWAHLIKAIDH